MNIQDYLLIAVGLAMDAFAVSICKGLSAGKATFRQALTAGLWFGGFQALMPAIGYFFGIQFRDLIAAVDHWIAFGLLTWIGIGTLRSASESEQINASFSAAEMFPLAVATSIDALAAGITLSFLNADLPAALLTIGVITALLSFIGVKSGTYLGEKNRKRAQILGGLVLIFIGIHILLEHLGII